MTVGGEELNSIGEMLLSAGLYVSENHFIADFSEIRLYSQTADSILNCLPFTIVISRCCHFRYHHFHYRPDRPLTPAWHP